jgi:hypothetical protein
LTLCPPYFGDRIFVWQTWFDMLRTLMHSNRRRLFVCWVVEWEKKEWKWLRNFFDNAHVGLTRKRETASHWMNSLSNLWMSQVRIGVLALQGAFKEHIDVLSKIEGLVFFCVWKTWTKSTLIDLEKEFLFRCWAERNQRSVWSCGWTRLPCRWFDNSWRWKYFDGTHWRWESEREENTILGAG